jgi:hypothetical protein
MSDSLASRIFTSVTDAINNPMIGQHQDDAVGLIATVL